MFLAFSGMFAMFFFNTLYIQKVLGFGPLKAGVAFLPFTAGIMVSAGPRLELRAADRCPADRRRRHGVDHSRAAALRPDARRRLVRGRRPAGDDPLVPRDGRHLHAADARGDDRPRQRGPGPRLGPLQHVAADRRRAWACDPVDDRRQSHERPVLSGFAGPRLPLRLRRCGRPRRPEPRRLRRAPAQAARCADRGRGRDGAGAGAPDDRATRRRAAQSRAGARRGGAGLRRVGPRREHRRDRPAGGGRPRDGLPPLPDQGRPDVRRHRAPRRADVRDRRGGARRRRSRRGVLRLRPPGGGARDDHARPAQVRRPLR